MYFSSKKRLISFERVLAIFLLSLMCGALLIKPVHIFFIHHNVVVMHDTETKISSPVEKDCPICDFEFFLYTSHTEHPLPQAALLPHQKERAVITSKAFNSFAGALSLRAPPVLSFI
ncbi:hypothetical protein [Microbacter margulisiae]|uniref:DUF2946 domain-containing protein n=1 Tax=Microbacter margulisiae TaxID=1350067 RepID=A0A7W5DRX4_9PORP|nr:hypothetical protein [Microbacter margulisiae]MBB3187108.1 hypothetical protein [Microbacter margulisiae]